MAAARRKTAKNPKAIIAAARLPQRSVDLCLRGDLVAQYQELFRALKDAQEQDKLSGSLDGGDTLHLAQQMDQLRTEMLDHTVDFVFRGLPRVSKDPNQVTWTALLAAHPPREDNEQDRTIGINRETFFDALIRASLVDPVLDEDDWAALEPNLSDGQYQALSNAAWAVNARDVDVPFSQRVSQILSSSAPE